MSGYDKATYDQWTDQGVVVAPKMTTHLYRRISRRWKGPIFQTFPRKQVKFQLACAELLKGRKVLDIGSNAGILTWELSQYADAVLGVEPNPVVYAQSLSTHAAMSVPCQFLNMDLRKFALEVDKHVFDAVFASRVLYHLSKYEVELLESKILPKCKVAVFLTHRDKSEAKMSNPFKLHSAFGLKTLLKKCGFQVEIVNQHTNWASVVGRRSE